MRYHIECMGENRLKKIFAMKQTREYVLYLDFAKRTDIYNIGTYEVPLILVTRIPTTTRIGLLYILASTT